MPRKKYKPNKGLDVHTPPTTSEECNNNNKNMTMELELEHVLTNRITKGRKRGGASVASKDGEGGEGSGIKRLPERRGQQEQNALFLDATVDPDWRTIHSLSIGVFFRRRRRMGRAGVC
jgi:hypothetical protein